MKTIQTKPMKVKYTKEQSDFIKHHGSYVPLEDKSEDWYWIPFWFKSTGEDCVFEPVLFDNLPDYLKEAIKRFRNTIVEPINDKVNEYPLTKEDADNKD
jgi:hypothetical protein